MKNQIWLVTLLLAAMAFAEETPPFNLTTLNGKKYTGVTVTRVEGDAIAINHDDGTARVYFADLPPELRTKYGYDPNKAAAAAAQRAEAMARQREIDAKNMEAEKQLKAAPFQQAEKEQATKMEAAEKARQSLESAKKTPGAGTSDGSGLNKAGATGELYGIFGSVLQVTPEGLLVKHGHRGGGTKAPKGEIVFLSGYPKILVDGSKLKCTAKHAGTYTYTAVDGGRTTVEAFSFAAQLY